MKPRAIERIALLGPEHLFVACQALIGRLRLIHERYVREGGGASQMAARAFEAAHVETCEALMNILTVLEAEGLRPEALADLRGGLDRALASARDLGFGSIPRS